MSEDLDRLEPWISAYAQRLTPVARRRLGLKIGRTLRKAQVQRITANVQPDGTAMEPRKRRADRRSGRVKAKGKMFRKIRLARNLKIDAGSDGVQIGFINPGIADTAAIHHFGKIGYVGRGFDGKVIRTKYTARRLLGFGPDDIDAIEDAVLAHLTGES